MRCRSHQRTCEPRKRIPRAEIVCTYFSCVHLYMNNELEPGEPPTPSSDLLSSPLPACKQSARMLTSTPLSPPRLPPQLHDAWVVDAVALVSQLAPPGQKIPADLRIRVQHQRCILRLQLDHAGPGSFAAPSVLMPSDHRPRQHRPRPTAASRRAAYPTATAKALAARLHFSLPLDTTTLSRRQLPGAVACLEVRAGRLSRDVRVPFVRKVSLPAAGRVSSE